MTEREHGAMNRRQAWNTRAFISLFLTLQFVVMTVSGVVRYISPRGREAHWVDWRILGLDKDQWSSVHMVSATAFLIVAGVHLAYNWRTFRSYLGGVRRMVRAKWREPAAAVAGTAVIVAMTVADVAPANHLFVASERLKDHYAATVAAPPWPHAEEASIEKVCKRLGIPVEAALLAMAEAGLPATDSSEALGAVGRRHGVSASAVFAPIRQWLAGSGTSQPARGDAPVWRGCEGRR